MWVVYIYIVMDKVLELMSKRKWQKHCLRVNVAQPEDIKITGSVKVAKIYSNVLNNREKEPELYDAIGTLHQSGGEMTCRSH